MIAALIVGGALLFGGGLATGVAVSRQKTERILEEQTQLIGALQDGQRALLDSAQKPVVLDAELKASLAAVPVQCLPDYGGAVDSVGCLWASCAAYGQSSANRPECSAITAALVESLRAASGAVDER